MARVANLPRYPDIGERGFWVPVNRKEVAMTTLGNPPGTMSFLVFSPASDEPTRHNGLDDEIIDTDPAERAAVRAWTQPSGWPADATEDLTLVSHPHRMGPGHAMLATDGRTILRVD